MLVSPVLSIVIPVDEADKVICPRHPRAGRRAVNHGCPFWKGRFMRRRVCVLVMLMGLALALPAYGDVLDPFDNAPSPEGTFGIGTYPSRRTSS